MRAKWSAPIRKYWKISEQMMVKYCDLAICDSVNTSIAMQEIQDRRDAVIIPNGMPLHKYANVYG